MLQQTQVERVVPRYLAWLERWPTVEALASALRGRRHPRVAGARLQPSRAEPASRGAPCCARRLARRPHGLPGCRPVYVGGHPLLRVRRGRAPCGRQRRARPATHGPASAPAAAQALMDLGATVCLARIPRCEMCPLAAAARRAALATSPRGSRGRSTARFDNGAPRLCGSSLTEPRRSTRSTPRPCARSSATDWSSISGRPGRAAGLDAVVAPRRSARCACRSPSSTTSVASAPGKTYSPSAGKSMPVHSAHSATGAADHHRPRRGREDLAADELVDTEPGIEVRAVVAPPAHVLLDRDERVALLPRRAHRRDHTGRKPGRARVVGERPDHPARQLSALVPGGDADRDRHQRGVRADRGSSRGRSPRPSRTGDPRASRPTAAGRRAPRRAARRRPRARPGSRGSPCRAGPSRDSPARSRSCTPGMSACVSSSKRRSRRSGRSAYRTMLHRREQGDRLCREPFATAREPQPVGRRRAHVDAVRVDAERAGEPSPHLVARRRRCAAPPRSGRSRRSRAPSPLRAPPRRPPGAGRATTRRGTARLPTGRASRCRRGSPLRARRRSTHAR